MRVASILAVCLVACVVVASCDDPGDVVAEGEGEGEGEVEGALVASDYCEQLAPIFCPFYLRCDRINVDAAADKDAACLAAFASSCEAGFEPRFKPLADDGLITLSRAGLETCAAHLQTATCDEQFLELSGPCAGIWQGTVDAGGACGIDAASFVCGPGTSCVLDLSFCGVCDTTLALGAVCRDGDTDIPGSCGPEAVCGADDVCVDRPNVGEACLDDGPPCALPARCAGDNICREPAVVVVGAACDREHRCGYRARCSAAVCTATVGPGEGCAADIDCDAGFCVDNVCTAVSAVGAACSADRECAAGCKNGVCAGFASTCL